MNFEFINAIPVIVIVAVVTALLHLQADRIRRLERQNRSLASENTSLEFQVGAQEQEIEQLNEKVEQAEEITDEFLQQAEFERMYDRWSRIFNGRTDQPAHPSDIYVLFAEQRRWTPEQVDALPSGFVNAYVSGERDAVWDFYVKCARRYNWTPDQVDDLPEDHMLALKAFLQAEADNSAARLKSYATVSPLYRIG